MFNKVFIANRGEIALRIIRACKELGLKTVIGYSEADRDSLPVHLADEKICIGPVQPTESYLNIPALISAMEIFDVDAVHPGYGFLSESIPFADICQSSKIIFIGPKAENIRLMGDKSLARDTVKKYGIPVIPGSDGIINDFASALHLCKKIGFPLIIKARGGGGGRGIRIVKNVEELKNFWATCQEEARIAFDNPDLYLEKYLERPRHIEVQILGDKNGNIIFFRKEIVPCNEGTKNSLKKAPRLLWTISCGNGWAKLLTE